MPKYFKKTLRENKINRELNTFVMATYKILITVVDRGMTTAIVALVINDKAIRVPLPLRSEPVRSAALSDALYWSVFAG